jgi:hypothetical protein
VNPKGELLPPEWYPERDRAELHAARLVGLDEEAALASAASNGFKVTVNRGRAYELSFDPSRINLRIEGGIVTAASVH